MLMAFLFTSELVLYGAVKAELSWNPLWESTQSCLVYDGLLTRGILVFRFGIDGGNQTCNLQVTASDGSQILLHTMNATMRHSWAQHNLIAEELIKCPGEYVSLQNKQNEVCFPYAISSQENILIAMKGTGSLMIQERSAQLFDEPCINEDSTMTVKLNVNFRLIPQMRL